MKSILFLAGLFFSTTLLANTSVFKSVISKNTGQQVASGQADTYLFLADNDTLDFMAPAKEANCDTIFDEYLKAVDFGTLKKLADDGHIYYSFIQLSAYFDSWSQQLQTCDVTAKGQMLFRITGIIQSIDDIGRAALEKYVAEMAKQHFFNYPIQWKKPLQIVTSYGFHNWQIANGDYDQAQDISYYKTSSAVKNDIDDMTLFDQAFKSPENKKALIDFFKQRLEDPSSAEKLIELDSQSKKTINVSFECDFIYVMSFDVSVSNLGMGQKEYYRCPGPGQCFH